MEQGEAVVKEIKVRDHLHADRLDLAIIDDFHCVVQKDKFETGDAVVYIPDGSILPDNLIEELGIRQYLAGKQKNRVKAAKLRKTLSQGIVYGPLGYDSGGCSLPGGDRYVPVSYTHLTLPTKA